MDVNPKPIPVLKSMFFSVIPLIAPNKAVDPTINKEYKKAVSGRIPKTVMRIGTVKIDPPLPTTPRVIPTINAKNKPIIKLISYF